MPKEKGSHRSSAGNGEQYAREPLRSRALRGPAPAQLRSLRYNEAAGVTLQHEVGGEKPDSSAVLVKYDTQQGARKSSGRKRREIDITNAFAGMGSPEQEYFDFENKLERDELLEHVKDSDASVTPAKANHGKRSSMSPGMEIPRDPVALGVWVPEGTTLDSLLDDPKVVEDLRDIASWIHRKHSIYAKAPVEIQNIVKAYGDDMEAARDQLRAFVR